MRAFLFLLGLGVGAIAWQPAHAAEAPPAPARASTPPLPPLKSPVAYFRTLLDQTPQARAQALNGKTDEQKKQLLAKLAEYETLAPDERELRLRVVEFQWYLAPLLHLAPTNRADRLAAIPEPQRHWIEQRLRDWDALPAAEQKDILENERALAYVVSFAPGGSPATLPTAQREKIEADLARWHTLPSERRQQALGNFQKYFDRPESEQQRTLNALSAVFSLLGFTPPIKGMPTREKP